MDRAAFRRVTQERHFSPVRLIWTGFGASLAVLLLQHEAALAQGTTL